MSQLAIPIAAALVVVVVGGGGGAVLSYMKPARLTVSFWVNEDNLRGQTFINIHKEL